MFSSPVAQKLPTQHPPQLSALHVLVSSSHVPAAVQSWPFLQAVQALPLIPHALVLVFSMQLSPAQQPSQLSGPHRTPKSWQLLPLHDWLPLHLEQNSPPIPQAVLLSPVRQFPARSQQPLQLSGPHDVLPAQVPLEHTCPAAHDVH